MSVRSEDGNRAAWLAIVLLVVSVPHALEDFAFREPARLGVAVGAALSALLVVYAMQLAGAWLAVGANPWGGRLVAAAGLIWFVGALMIHGPEIRAVGSTWRFGPTSIGGVMLIVVAGALSMWYGSIASQRAARRRP